MKTLENWGKNGEIYLEDYLYPGDIVDEEMYWHFLNVLPPLTNRGDMLQVGEVYTHIGGRGVYTTFAKENNMWVYKGFCFRGEAENYIAHRQCA